MLRSGPSWAGPEPRLARGVGRLVRQAELGPSATWLPGLPVVLLVMAPQEKKRAARAAVAAASVAAGVPVRTQQLADVFARYGGHQPHDEGDAPRDEGHVPHYDRAGVSPTVADATSAEECDTTAAVLLLKKLRKRSAATRVRAAQEFAAFLEKELASGPDVAAASVRRWLPEFCRVYRNTVLFDSESRVRGGLNRSLRDVVRVCGRRLGSASIESLLPTWWISRWDPSPDVAEAAEEGLRQLWPDTAKFVRVVEFLR